MPLGKDEFLIVVVVDLSPDGPSCLDVQVVVKGSDTVLDLKGNAVSNNPKQFENFKEFHLVYENEKTSTMEKLDEDEKTLADYGIKSGAKIHFKQTMPS